MKAVILAAGKSTRLLPLTAGRSKVMLPVANVTIIGHNLRELEQTKLINEAIVVVGFGSEEIMATLGNKYGSMSIAYAFQTEQQGTGHALLQAEKFLSKEKKFIVLMGDDIYSSSDLKNCLKHGSCLLAKKVASVRSFAKVVAEKGMLKQLIEKPDENRYEKTKK